MPWISRCMGNALSIAHWRLPLAGGQGTVQTGLSSFSAKPRNNAWHGVGKENTLTGLPRFGTLNACPNNTLED